MMYPRTTAGGFPFPESEVVVVVAAALLLPFKPPLLPRNVDGIVRVVIVGGGGNGSGVVVITVPALTPLTPLTCAAEDDI